MITVCLDWNCIIALEAEREYSPAIRQIREWYKQGKIALFMGRPSRLENHSSKDRTLYNEQEWTEKLRNVGLVYRDNNVLYHTIMFCTHSYD